MQKVSALYDIQDKYEKQDNLYGKKQGRYKSLRNSLVSFMKYYSALWQITRNDVSTVARKLMAGIS